MKNTIVIGGSKGIGLSISKAFLKRGDNLFILSRNKIKYKNSYSLDLSNVNEIREFFDKFNKKNIKIDYLVFSQRYRGNDYDEENLVMLKSTQIVIEKLDKKFKKNSSIVFIGSPASKYISDKVNLSYHLTRASLENLMKYYSVNLGKKGIRSNSVLTGTIIKEENRVFYKNNPSKIKNLIKKTPLKRIGNAEDLSNLVLFLCSDKSTFINGQSILVDGGLSVLMNESLI